MARFRESKATDDRYARMRQLTCDHENPLPLLDERGALALGSLGVGLGEAFAHFAMCVHPADAERLFLSMGSMFKDALALNTSASRAQTIRDTCVLAFKDGATQELTQAGGRGNRPGGG